VAKERFEDDKRAEELAKQDMRRAFAARTQYSKAVDRSERYKMLIAMPPTLQEKKDGHS